MHFVILLVLVCVRGLLCFSCYGYDSWNTSVCNSHGTCVSEDTCQEMYSGWTCSISTKCYGVSFDSEEVCSGSGACVSENVCVCAEDFEGSQCEDNTKMDDITSQVTSFVLYAISGLLTFICFVLFVAGCVFLLMKLRAYLRFKHTKKKIVPVGREEEIPPKLDISELDEDVNVEETEEFLDRQMEEVSEMISEMKQVAMNNQDYEMKRCCVKWLEKARLHGLRLSTPMKIFREMIDVVEILVTELENNEDVMFLAVKCLHESALLVLYKQLRERPFRPVPQEMKDKALQILQQVFSRNYYSPLSFEIDCATQCILRLSTKSSEISSIVGDFVDMINSVKDQDVSALVNKIKGVKETTLERWYQKLLALRMSFRFRVKNGGKLKLARYWRSFYKLEWHVYMAFIGFCKEMLNEMYSEACSIPNSWYSKTPELFKDRDSAKLKTFESNIWEFLEMVILRKYTYCHKGVKNVDMKMDFLRIYAFKRLFSLLDKPEFTYQKHLNELFETAIQKDKSEMSLIIKAKSYPLVRAWSSSVLPFDFSLGMSSTAHLVREDHYNIQRQGEQSGNGVKTSIGDISKFLVADTTETKAKVVVLSGSVGMGQGLLLRKFACEIFPQEKINYLSKNDAFPVLIGAHEFSEKLNKLTTMKKEDAEMTSEFLAGCVVKSVSWTYHMWDEMKRFVFCKQIEKVIDNSNVIILIDHFNELNSHAAERCLKFLMENQDGFRKLLITVYDRDLGRIRETLGQYPVEYIRLLDPVSLVHRASTSTSKAQTEQEHEMEARDRALRCTDISEVRNMLDVLLIEDSVKSRTLRVFEKYETIPRTRLLTSLVAKRFVDSNDANANFSTTFGVFEDVLARILKRHLNEDHLGGNHEKSVLEKAGVLWTMRFISIMSYLASIIVEARLKSLFSRKVAIDHSLLTKIAKKEVILILQDKEIWSEVIYQELWILNYPNSIERTLDDTTALNFFFDVCGDELFRLRNPEVWKFFDARFINDNSCRKLKGLLDAAVGVNLDFGDVAVLKKWFWREVLKYAIVPRNLVRMLKQLIGVSSGDGSEEWVSVISSEIPSSRGEFTKKNKWYWIKKVLGVKIAQNKNFLIERHPVVYDNILKKLL